MARQLGATDTQEAARRGIAGSDRLKDGQQRDPQFSSPAQGCAVLRR